MNWGETAEQKRQRLAPHRAKLAEIKAVRRLRNLTPLTAWQCSAIVRASERGDNVEYWKNR